MRAAFAPAFVLAFGLHGSLGHAELSPADLNPDQTAVQIPQGATANRPSGTGGLLRYNVDHSAIEGFVKGQWKTLATVDAEPEQKPAAEPAPAPEQNATAGEIKPDGAHEFANPFADITKLKAAISKLEGLSLDEVNKIKAKVASIEAQFKSFAARLAKLEEQLKK